MAYSKQNWANNPAGGTPITAERLNYMETGIEGAATTADAAANTASNTASQFDSLVYPTGIENDPNTAGQAIVTNNDGSTSILTLPPGPAGADGTNGADGADGAAGTGITGITDNGDGTMTINLSDSTSYNVNIPGGGGSSLEGLRVTALWNGTGWVYGGSELTARPTLPANTYLDLVGAPAATETPTWLVPGDARSDQLVPALFTVPSGYTLYPKHMAYAVTASVTAGQVIFGPIDVDNPQAFNRIGLNVNSAEAGGDAGTWTLGLYEDDGTGCYPKLDGGPIETGTISGATAGNQWVNFTASRVLAGRWWIASLYVAGATPATTLPTVKSVNYAGYSLPSTGGYGIGTQIRGRKISGVTALPTTAVTMSDEGGSNTPLMVLRTP